MKKVLCIILFGVLVLLLVCMPATASLVVNSDGYYSDNGYWWRDGVAYTRTDKWTWVAGWYDYYRCWHAGYWSFAGYAYSRIQINASDKTAEDQLVALAVARAKTQDKMALEQQRHLNLLQLSDKMGLTANFTYRGQYGGFTAYPQGGNFQLSSAGYNGNTVYGYTYANAAEAYGTTDLNVLYQSANRQTVNAQQLAGQAATEFNGLVDKAGSNAARIAEIRAKLELGKQLLDSIKGTPEVRTEQRVFTFGPGPASTEPAVQPRVTEFVKLAGPASCMACHSGNKLEGGFDVTKVPQMKAGDIIAKVMPRLVTDDPAKRMPKGGPALTGEQVRQFLGGQ